MTFAEFHLAVRHLLRQTPYPSFVVVVEAVETPPQRVDVEWRVCLTDHPDHVFVRGRDPHVVISTVKSEIERLGNPSPANSNHELVAVGAPLPRS